MCSTEVTIARKYSVSQARAGVVALVIKEL